MLSPCLVPSITKKFSSYSLVLGQQQLQLSALRKQSKVFECMLKLLETYLIRSYFYSNTKKHKNKKKTSKKKTGQILIWHQIPLLKKFKLFQ